MTTIAEVESHVGRVEARLASLESVLDDTAVSIIASQEAINASLLALHEKVDALMDATNQIGVHQSYLTQQAEAAQQQLNGMLGNLAGGGAGGGMLGRLVSKMAGGMLNTPVLNTRAIEGETDGHQG